MPPDDYEQPHNLVEGTPFAGVAGAGLEEITGLKSGSRLDSIDRSGDNFSRYARGYDTEPTPEPPPEPPFPTPSPTPLPIPSPEPNPVPPPETDCTCTLDVMSNISLGGYTGVFRLKGDTSAPGNYHIYCPTGAFKFKAANSGALGGWQDSLAGVMTCGEQIEFKAVTAHIEPHLIVGQWGSLRCSQLVGIDRPRKPGQENCTCDAFCIRIADNLDIERVDKCELVLKSPDPTVFPPEDPADVSAVIVVSIAGPSDQEVVWDAKPVGKYLKLSKDTGRLACGDLDFFLVSPTDYAIAALASGQPSVTEFVEVRLGSDDCATIEVAIRPSDRTIEGANSLTLAGSGLMQALAPKCFCIMLTETNDTYSFHSPDGDEWYSLSNPEYTQKTETVINSEGKRVERTRTVVTPISSGVAKVINEAIAKRINNMESGTTLGSRQIRAENYQSNVEYEKRRDRESQGNPERSEDLQIRALGPWRISQLRSGQQDNSTSYVDSVDHDMGAQYAVAIVVAAECDCKPGNPLEAAPGGIAGTFYFQWYRKLPTRERDLKGREEWRYTEEESEFEGGYHLGPPYARQVVVDPGGSYRKETLDEWDARLKSLGLRNGRHDDAGLRAKSGEYILSLMRPAIFPPTEEDKRAGIDHRYNATYADDYYDMINPANIEGFTPADVEQELETDLGWDEDNLALSPTGAKTPYSELFAGITTQETNVEWAAPPYKDGQGNCVAAFVDSPGTWEDRPRLPIQELRKFDEIEEDYRFETERIAKEYSDRIAKAQNAPQRERPGLIKDVMAWKALQEQARDAQFGWDAAPIAMSIGEWKKTTARLYKSRVSVHRDGVGTSPGCVVERSFLWRVALRWHIPIEEFIRRRYEILYPPNGEYVQLGRVFGISEMIGQPLQKMFPLP
ncbi:MAG: hypothetical protein R3E76_07890 [Planctomycetota bacterium]